MAHMVGPNPIWTTCPNGNTEILTRTRKSISNWQCLFAGGLCLFSCGMYFLIPLCMNDWTDAQTDVLHTCPNCNYAIGKYKNDELTLQKSPKEAQNDLLISTKIFFNMRISTMNKVQVIIWNTIDYFILTSILDPFLSLDNQTG